MAERGLIYFIADVHLGLDVCNPMAREARLVGFLRSIPPDRTARLYMLGDIWDFWYEYHDVVPAGYASVFAALQDLMEAGVEVHFISGNHDAWCYRYFADMGIIVHHGVLRTDFQGASFVLAHGDGLGPGHLGYKIMKSVFRSRLTQWLFSTFVPVRLAFALGKTWSRRSRLARRSRYEFKGASEGLYHWACGLEPRPDFVILGHLHCKVDMVLPSEARLLILKDWIEGVDALCFDGREMHRISVI